MYIERTILGRERERLRLKLSRLSQTKESEAIDLGC